MKIGLNVSDFVLNSGDEHLALLEKSGFDCIDYFLRPEVEDPAANAKKLLSLCRKHGLEISQTHLPMCPDCVEEDFLSARYVGQVVKGIERTAALGVRYAVVHPYIPRGLERFEMGLPYDYELYRAHNFDVNMEFFSAIRPVAEREGVVLCIENLFAHDWVLHCHVPSACSDPHETLAYITALGSKNFAACYDTGHHNLYGGDPAEFVGVLGEHIKVLHTHTNYGQRERGLDWHMMPGVGDLDFEALLRALHAAKFAGTLSFEVNTFSYLRDIQFDYIAKAARRMIELFYKE